MNWSDVYAMTTIGAVILSIAVVVGWSIDRWPEWRTAHRKRRQAYLEWLDAHGEGGPR